MDSTKLFDFVKILYEKPALYNKLKSYEKAKHFFMIQRFMSINFPLQANQLQLLRINPSEVMDYWQSTVVRLYSKVPAWMYTKTAAQKKVTKNKYIEEATMIEYRERFQLSQKQIDTAINMFGEDMINELKKFEKLVKQRR